jgi:antitoxin component YwqK of YwqJK toxin-antitoxin module
MKMDQSRTDSSGRLKQGPYTEYFKGGSVSCVGEFAEGLKTGEWKYFLKNGRLKAIGRYENDEMTGEWRWYRENGELMQTGSFLNNKKPACATLPSERVASRRG